MRDINKEAINISTNILRSSFFKRWYLDRGLRLVDYQQEILSNKINFEGEPIVLAVAPGGGKTLMSIAAIDKYCIDNPSHKVLVLTHGQTVLRSQYAHNIDKVKPSFSWAMVLSDVNPKCELPQLKAEDIIITKKQVIISLPQSIVKTDLPHFDLIVVDEAHQFYFAKMVQSIIKRSRPYNQLLLTGTPSSFIARKYKNIICISLEILFRNKMISDPIIEIAGSSYDFKLSDYSQEYELKDSIDMKEEDTNSTLNLVLNEICKRLKTESNWISALKIMSKTMLVCRNQKQAKDVQEFFFRNKINVALSISDCQLNSEEIERFKKEKDCYVLIVVRRGILGFDFPSLVNVIDISCSQNVDRILQLLCRVVRISPNNEQKLFYKVCPTDLVEHFKYIMTAVLCLSKQEYFVKFDGKNFIDLSIPAIVRSTLSSNSCSLENKNRKRKNKGSSFKPIEFLGLPAFNFFSQCIDDIKNNVLNTYAYTTLREVSMTNTYLKGLSKEERFEKCKMTYLENNCKNITEYIRIDEAGHEFLIKNGLLDKFYQILGISLKFAILRMTKKERLELIYKKFLDNKCSSISDLRKYDSSGYCYLYKRKLIDVFCKTHKIKVTNAKLSKEELFELCRNNIVRCKYTKASEFLYSDSTNYEYMRRNGWLDEFFEYSGINRQLRKWNRYSKDENFTYIFNKYHEFGCSGIKDLSKVENAGCIYLRRKKLMNEFREKYNIQICKRKGRFSKN